MSPVTTAFVVLLATTNLPRSRANCASKVPGENACTIRGSLALSSVPDNLPVNSENCNKVYDKEAFQTKPEVRYPDATAGQSYTLVMVDPDAINITQEQYYLHWIQANIPGEDFMNGNLYNSTEITSYQGPAPPQNTGLHRYMFLVYRHLRPSARLTTPVQSPERAAFSLGDWLRGNGRQGKRLCGPVSGVQFRSGFEQVTFSRPTPSEKTFSSPAPTSHCLDF